MVKDFMHLLAGSRRRGPTALRRLHIELLESRLALSAMGLTASSSLAWPSPVQTSPGLLAPDTVAKSLEAHYLSTPYRQEAGKELSGGLSRFSFDEDEAVLVQSTSWRSSTVAVSSVATAGFERQLFSGTIDAFRPNSSGEGGLVIIIGMPSWPSSHSSSYVAEPAKPLKTTSPLAYPRGSDAVSELTPLAGSRPTSPAYTVEHGGPASLPLDLPPAPVQVAPPAKGGNVAALASDSRGVHDWSVGWLSSGRGLAADAAFGDARSVEAPGLSATRHDDSMAELLGPTDRDRPSSTSSNAEGGLVEIGARTEASIQSSRRARHAAADKPLGGSAEQGLLESVWSQFGREEKAADRAFPVFENSQPAGERAVGSDQAGPVPQDPGATSDSQEGGMIELAAAAVFAVVPSGDQTDSIGPAVGPAAAEIRMDKGAGLFQAFELGGLQTHQEQPGPTSAEEIQEGPREETGLSTSAAGTPGSDDSVSQGEASAHKFVHLAAVPAFVAMSLLERRVRVLGRRSVRFLASLLGRPL